MIEHNARTLKDGWPAGSELKRGDTFACDPAELAKNMAEGNCVGVEEPWPPVDEAEVETDGEGQTEA